MLRYLLSGILILLVYCYLRWYRMITHKMEGLASLSGPMNLPIIGAVHALFPPSQSLWLVNKLHKKYGKTFKLSTPYTAGIVTKDVAFVEFIMTSPACINKSYLYEFMTNWLGEGLLISKSEKWHRRRKLLTPAFHFKILDGFYEVFNKNDKILIDQLQKCLKTTTRVNILEFISLAALDNINETAMGTNVNAQIGGHADYVKATKFLTQLLYNRVASVFKCSDALFFFTSDYWKEKKCLRVVHGYSKSIIKQRRSELCSNPKSSLDENCNDDDLCIKKKTAFLDLLLQTTVDGEPLSDADICEEVDTFMFEGHDTVSAGISFALFLIAKHSNVQAKIVDEQRAIYGSDRTRDTTSDDLRRMVYLEMVIKETLRLYPSVPGIARIVSADFEFNGMRLRKDTELLIPIHALHKDPDVFPDPERFDPERFAAEQQAKRNPYAYIPFSAGYRNGIGQKFAMIELKMTLSRVCRHFELAATIPEHIIELPSAIVLYAANGVYIDLKERKWSGTILFNT